MAPKFFAPDPPAIFVTATLNTENPKDITTVPVTIVGNKKLIFLNTNPNTIAIKDAAICAPNIVAKL